MPDTVFDFSDPNRPTTVQTASKFEWPSAADLHQAIQTIDKVRSIKAEEIRILEIDLDILRRAQALTKEEDKR